MIQVGLSSSFKRAFKKRIKGNVDLEARFWQKLEQFTADPFDPSLRTHKLLGKFQGLSSFSIDYDARVIFEFTDDGNAVLLNIGSHDEVY